MNPCFNSKCENTTNTKYCSKSCAATVNNSLHPKREPRRSAKCLRCSNIFPVSKNSKGKFCSHECSSKFKSENIISQWMSGEISGGNSAGNLIPTIRKFLLEEANHQCECGWNTPNPVTGEVFLTVDHIDGNWKNNKRNNLKVLCYNCHTLTPTFGALNRGKFPENKRNVGSRRN